MPIPLVEDRGFAFDLDVFRSKLSDRTKLIILNSPQNPTGGVIGAAEVTRAAELIGETDAWILSDEVYAQMVYDGTLTHRQGKDLLYALVNYESDATAQLH